MDLSDELGQHGRSETGIREIEGKNSRHVGKN